MLPVTVLLFTSQGLKLHERLEGTLPNPLCPLTLLHLATGQVLDQLSCRECHQQFISESLLLQVMKTRPGETMSSKPVHSHSDFTPYSSPLLTYQSYRLNPFYRTQFGLPLSSPTYSHQIDPGRIMCRFDMQGRCNDPKCPAQHFKEILPSTKQLLEDLSSYQYGGREEGRADSDLDQLESFRGKVKNEELLQLAAHSTRKRLMKGKHSSCINYGLLTQPAPDCKGEEKGGGGGERPPVLVDSDDGPVMPVDLRDR